MSDSQQLSQEDRSGENNPMFLGVRTGENHPLYGKVPANAFLSLVFSDIHKHSLLYRTDTIEYLVPLRVAKQPGT